MTFTYLSGWRLPKWENTLIIAWVFLFALKTNRLTTMTVQELKDKLAQYPSDYEIVADFENDIGALHTRSVTDLTTYDGDVNTVTILTDYQEE